MKDKSPTKVDSEWPFDQAKNVAAITTKQVIYDHFPVLSVVHHENDASWAFTCGTTNRSEDLLVVGMGEILHTDESLYGVADLPVGWSATRESLTGKWTRVKD